jgi:hypothetical protein
MRSGEALNHGPVLVLERDTAGEAIARRVSSWRGAKGSRKRPFWNQLRRLGMHRILANRPGERLELWIVAGVLQAAAAREKVSVDG